MKDFLKLLKRFIPPYKWKLAWNFLFNLLSAVFGIFSFFLMKPTLEILFGTSEKVLVKPELATNISAITDYFNYYVSNIIQDYGAERALIFVALFIILTVFL